MRNGRKIHPLGRRLLAGVLALMMLFTVYPVTASAAQAGTNTVLQINAGQKDNKTDIARAKISIPDGLITSDNYTVSYHYRNTAAKNARINYTLWNADGTETGGKIGPENGIVDFGVHNSDDYTIRYNGGTWYPVANLNEWNLIEFRVTATKFAMYVNGTKIAESDFDAKKNGKPKLLRLGGGYEGTGGVGQFDDFKVTQDGKEIYSQNFESATLDSLAKEGWQFPTGGTGAVSFEKVTSETPVEEKEHVLQINAGQMGNDQANYAWAKLTLPEDKQISGKYTVSYDYRNTAAANGRVNFTLWKAEGTETGKYIGPQYGIVDYGAHGTDNYSIRYNGGAIYPMADLSVWNHVEYRVDGNQFAMYVNGAKVADSTFDASASGKIKSILLGGAYGGTGGVGQFDNFKITQDGKDVYAQDFESATTDSLKTEGWLLAQAAGGMNSVAEVEKQKAKAENYSLQVNAGQKGSNDVAWAKFTLPEDKQVSGQYTVSYDYRNTAAKDARINFTLWNATGTAGKPIGPVNGIVDFGAHGTDSYTIRYNGGTIYPMSNLSEWNHMEYRVNGNQFAMYVNGAKVADSTFDSAASGKLGTILLGGSYNGTGGVGQFDNFKISQNGKDVYVQNFETATVESLQAEGWQFLADGAGKNSVEATDPVKQPSATKNSLQVSGGNGQTGWAKLNNLNITSDNYSYSFDYKNIRTPDAADSSNCFFLVMQDDCMNQFIKNNSEGLQIMLDSKQRVDLKMDMKKWNHFDINVKGSSVEVLINGKSCFTGTLSTDKKPASFGWIGDGDSGTYWDGSSLYDNFVLKQDGKVTYQENFDGRTIPQLQQSGWYFSSAGAMAISTMDASDTDGLASLKAEPEQTVFTKGITAKAGDFLKLSAKMADGSDVAAGKLNAVYTSSDPNTVEVTTQDSVPAFAFKAAGSAKITASLTLDGVTKTAEIPVSVIDGVEPVALAVENEGTHLVVGTTMALTISARMSNMIVRALTADEIKADGITVTSGNGSVVAVNGTALTAVKAGTADITVTGTIGGRNLKRTFSVTAAAIKAVEAEILASNLYLGDKITVAARGVMSDGGEIDLTSQAQFTAENASVSKDGEKTVMDCGQTGPVKLSASYGGFTGAAEAEVKAISVAKTRASYYTTERVENLRANAEKYSWGQSIKSGIVGKADDWFRKYGTLEAIRSVIPSQDIGRTFGVNPGGCLVCGRAVLNSYGNYPFRWDVSSEDWKITCPYCGMQFPSNNFAAYYKNGLNEAGEFDAKLAKARNNALIAKGEKGNLVNLYAVNGLPADKEKHVREELAAAKTAGGDRMYTDAQIDEKIHSIKTDLTWAVDDGMGYHWDGTDTEKYGNPYTFIGYYAHYAIWHGNTAIVYGMINDFAQAYLYTGEQKYADAAIVLLDRVADEYPEMHVSAYPHNKYYGFTNSDGHNTEKSLGRIVGSIWDNADSKNLLYSYDAIYPAIATMGEGARSFLAQASGNPQAGAADRIKVHFEDGVIREVAKAFRAGDLSANPGSAQTTLAVAAVVMDHYPETQEWLNLDYAPGECDYRTPQEKRTGNILGVLANDVDPDGQGYECSLGYNAGWTSSWIEVADVLDSYALPKDAAGKEHALNLPKGTSADLYLNPRFRKMLLANCSLLLTNEYIPNIGDTGATAKPGSTSILDADLLLKAYDRLTNLDAEGAAAGDYDVLAQTLYLLNSKSTNNLHTNIFSADPQAAAKKIQNVINTKGELNLGSQNFSSFGLGILRDGTDKTASVYRGTDFFFPSMAKTFAGGASNDNGKTIDQINPNGAAGASVTYPFSFDGTADSYQMYLKLHCFPGGWGKWDVTLNGAKLGTVDFGSSELPAGTNLIKLADVKNLRKTGNELTFTCVGGAGAMKMGVYDMYFLEAGKTMPPLNIKSDTTQRALWMFYGSAGSSHGHADPLNLGYMGYNLDLMPDLGYPNTAGGNDNAKVFENSNMAHNTVSFSTATDRLYFAHYRNYGRIDRFDGGNGSVQVMNAYTPGVINSGVSYADQFNRTSALIRIDGLNSYIVDLFRVKGADANREYQYNFHTTEIDKAKTALTGLSGAKQVAPDGGYHAETMQNVSQYSKTGDSFSVDWNVKDTWNQLKNGTSAATDIHMKVTMLNAADYNRVMLGEIVPPQNYTRVNSLPNLMVTGKGQTTFTSVMEAYQKDSNILSTEPLAVTENGKPADSQTVRALKVTLKNGRTDYIVNSLDTSKTYSVAGKFDFKGFFGVYSEENGKTACTYLMDGSQLGGTKALNAVTGTVTGMTDGLSTKNYIDIRADEAISPASLTGKYIHVDNADVYGPNVSADDPSGYDHKKTGRYVYNAVYRIFGVEKQADGTIRLDVGDTSVVRGVADDGITALPNFNKGSAFRIPLSTTVGGTDVKAEISYENGQQSIKKNFPEGSVECSKTVQESKDDAQKFDVTLNVKLAQSALSQKPVNAVLVLDQSASMYGDKMKQTIGAAQKFADQLLGGSLGTKNKVAVVGYGKYAKTVVGLTGSDGLAAVKSKLASMDAHKSGLFDRFLDLFDCIKKHEDGGTNTQAGLTQAQKILENSGDKDAKNIVVLVSDGAPTYSLKAGDYSKDTSLTDANGSKYGAELTKFGSGVCGGGSSYGMNWLDSYTLHHGKIFRKSWDTFTVKDNILPTLSQAKQMKEEGTRIYSVLLMGSAEKDFKAAEHTLSGVASDGCYWNVKTAAELASKLSAAAEAAVSKLTLLKVEDHFGSLVNYAGDNKAADAKFDEASETLTWDLSKAKGTVNEDGSVTYTLAYPVVLKNPAAEAGKIHTYYLSSYDYDQTTKTRTSRTVLDLRTGSDGAAVQVPFNLPMIQKYVKAS